MRVGILSFALLATALPLPAQAPRGYYRYPTIRSNSIVFAAEGDLWRVDAKGGMAVRLTSHPGEEAFPAISPDGRTLAFTGQYEGPSEVYTMPLEGGLPQRRTWQGTNAFVVGWTPSGKILYSTASFSTLPNRQIATIDPTNGRIELLPLNQASDGAYEPGERTFFFTRLPFQGSYTKRYKGGTAQNLWKFTGGQPEAVPLTADFAGTSASPMLWRGRVYFASDRDGTMNIWSMREDGKDLRQHTRHKGWDVKSPALGDGRIVYQLGADLHLFDIAAGSDSLLNITLPSDLDQLREKWLPKPSDYLSSVRLSPKGDRLALTARGQVFVVPAEQGRLVEATHKRIVRYRNALFMPDGKSLLALTDESGELEFCRIPANGVGEAAALTSDGKVFRLAGLPSPDGKKIAYSDKSLDLWIFDLEQKRQVKVTTSRAGTITDMSWSPDSRWLAFVAPAENTFDQIVLYRLEDEARTPVTSDRVNSASPAWSPDGKWIYFLSDRNLQSLVGSPWGPYQPEPFFDKTMRVYQAALAAGQRSPFQPADELFTPEPAKKEADAAKPAPVEVRIEPAGIQARVQEVPVPPGNYGQLAVNEKRLFLTTRETSMPMRRALAAIEIGPKDPQVKSLAEDIRAYELSLDGKKIMLRKGEDIFVIDSSSDAPAKLDNKRVNLGDWSLSLLPRDEWRQVFVEAWRMERDYFYDRNMHGLDWPAMLKKYLPLVDRVTNREELNDLIAQLLGELSALHTYVFGGDARKGPDDVTVGSLGAVLIRDEKGGGYRVEHIYRSDPDYPERMSPLSQPGVGAHDGDIIEAVDGVSTLSVPDLAPLLRRKAGKQVLLKLRPGADAAAREVIVVPMTASREATLRYEEWEYTRRLRVEEIGKGDIGYVHLTAMGGSNYSEWARNFYPVFNRKGLIVDVRHNRGGNIDSWILEKLLRRAWFFWQPRAGDPYWNMQYAFRGHIVVLCNERTASDGEAFAEGFRRLGLGKLIGTRTWGGEIWLSMSPWLVDNGFASAAEMGVYGPEGAWLIEGHGVDPDIVVDNPPHATFNGGDAQLEAAVNYLQEQIRLKPITVPPAPKYPDKSIK